MQLAALQFFVARPCLRQALFAVLLILPLLSLCSPIFSVSSVLNLLPFSESRYRAIHPSNRQRRFEGCALCVSAVNHA
jgi:hypothetical protein